MIRIREDKEFYTREEWHRLTRERDEAIGHLQTVLDVYRIADCYCCAPCDCEKKVEDARRWLEERIKKQ